MIRSANRWWRKGVEGVVGEWEIEEVVVPEEVVVMRSQLADRLEEGAGGVHDPEAVSSKT